MLSSVAFLIRSASSQSRVLRFELESGPSNGSFPHMPALVCSSPNVGEVCDCYGHVLGSAGMPQGLWCVFSSQNMNYSWEHSLVWFPLRDTISNANLAEGGQSSEVIGRDFADRSSHSSGIAEEDRGITRSRQCRNDEKKWSNSN